MCRWIHSTTLSLKMLEFHIEVEIELAKWLHGILKLEQYQPGFLGPYFDFSI